MMAYVKHQTSAPRLAAAALHIEGQFDEVRYYSDGEYILRIQDDDDEGVRITIPHPEQVD